MGRSFDGDCHVSQLPQQAAPFFAGGAPLGGKGKQKIVEAICFVGREQEGALCGVEEPAKDYLRRTPRAVARSQFCLGDNLFAKGFVIHMCREAEDLINRVQKAPQGGL